MTVEESISCYYTVSRYGCYGAGREREVSQVHGGGVLARSSCAGLARVIRLGCFYCDVSVTNFFYEASWAGFCDEASQTRKKEEALLRVLLFSYGIDRDLFVLRAAFVRSLDFVVVFLLIHF